MEHIDSDLYRVIFPPENIRLVPGDSISYQLIARDIAQTANISMSPDSGAYLFKILPDISLLSGFVSLSDSTNLSNIFLFLSGEMSDTALTDTNGYYNFEHLRDGVYNVQVHKDNYFTMDSLISGIIVKQDTVSNVNFVLSPLTPGSVSGFVNLEGNSDSSGVIVSITSQELFDTTNANGAFDFTNVFPGKISILFEKEGYITDRLDTLLNNEQNISNLNMTLVKNIKPQNLHVVNSLDSVVIAWDDISQQLKISAKDEEIEKSYFKNLTLNAEYFQIYRSRDSLQFTLKADSIDVLNYIDREVEIGEQYWYYIRAFYDGHWSENSNIVKAFVESGAGYEALIYDDGTAVSGYFWTTAGAGSGNRMSPLHRIKIISAKFYLLTPNKGDNTFTAKIFDFDGIKPGVELGQTDVIQAPNNQWVEADFSTQNIFTDHDFIVFMTYDGINEPVFAYDTTNNGRAWDYNQVNGNWVQVNQTYLMRANVQLITGLDDEQNALPKTFSLSQNYPNPFNPETIIRYTLPKNAGVNLTVYNTLGQKIRILIDNEQPAGKYSVKWDGKNDNRQSVASGIYILQFKSAKFTKVQKMLLIR